MPPELVEPTFGRTSQSSWEQHTPELSVHVASSHYHIEGAEMAPRVGGAIVRGNMGQLEPVRERCV